MIAGAKSWVRDLASACYETSLELIDSLAKIRRRTYLKVAAAVIAVELAALMNAIPTLAKAVGL